MLRLRAFAPRGARRLVDLVTYLTPKKTPKRLAHGAARTRNGVQNEDARGPLGPQTGPPGGAARPAPTQAAFLPRPPAQGEPGASARSRSLGFSAACGAPVDPPNACSGGQEVTGGQSAGAETLASIGHVGGSAGVRAAPSPTRRRCWRDERPGRVENSGDCPLRARGRRPRGEARD